MQTLIQVTPQSLRALRLKLDLTQSQMADKLLMSRVMYGMNERGIKPISRRTQALANELNQKLNVPIALS